MPDINIKELLWAVREQLEASEKKRLELNKDALFQIDTLDLELNFVVADSEEAEGGFDFKIVKIGGKKGTANEAVQKIKLSLKAVDRSTETDLDMGGIFPMQLAPPKFPTGTFPMTSPTYPFVGGFGGGGKPDKK